MASNPHDQLSVFELMQNHVRSSPDAVAISKQGTSLTYAELDRASQGVASLLSSRGVGRGDLIPLLTSRCMEMAACVLGIVRIGATWIPMEVGTWSQDRIDTVLETLDYTLVLITDETSSEGVTDRMINGQQIREAIDLGLRGQLAPQINSPTTLDNIAYIIFTSGTTGVPKGVMIKHESLLNYVMPDSHDADAPFNLGARPSDISLLLFSVAFDAFYGVLFSTWCAGGQVLLSEASTFIDDSKICTLLPATPTLLGTIEPADYKNLRGIFVGGEAPSPALVKRWWTPNRRMFNAYGPTEATVSVTIAEMRPGSPIVLGKAIRNSRVFLLDSQMEECSEGEICVSGHVVLALGYYKNPEKTEEKFIQWKGERIYRTGDMAKMTEDGLVFLGRQDQIVKNRGFLVNLEAEVIPPLLSHDSVSAATAFMHRQRLIAFVVAPGLENGETIRESLKSTLDQFLVPDEIRCVSQLPQTANGKIDTKALLNDVLRTDMLNVEIESPTERSSSDHNLTLFKQAIAEAIQVAPSSVNVSRSFVQLGGNSMSAIKVISKLRQQGLSATMASLFLEPTLAAVYEELIQAAGQSEDAVPGEQHYDYDGAKRSNGQRKENVGEKTNADIGEQFSMTYTQKALIRSTLSEPPTGYMMVSIAMELGGKISGKTLELAWRVALARSDLFRTSFDLALGQAEVLDEYHHDWQIVKVTSDKLPEVVAAQSELLFNLAKENAVRMGGRCKPVNSFRLIESDNGSSRLLWMVHHALLDGWSVACIINQVKGQLSSQGDGERLPPIVPFSTYAQALDPYLKRFRQPALDFWTSTLTGFLNGTDLRIPPVRGDISNSSKGYRLGFGEATLGLGMTLEQLQINAQATCSVSPAVIFHAAWAILLQRYSQKNEVVFGSALSARNFPVTGVEDIIGPLLNQCPIPIRVDSTTARNSFLIGVQDLLLKIAEYQWFSSDALEEMASESHARLFTTALYLEYDLAFFEDEPSQEPSSPWSFQRTDWPETGLALYVQQVDGNLCFRALFKKTEYQSQTVQKILVHLQNLCQALIHPDNALLSSVQDKMLDVDEVLQLLRSNTSLHQPYFGPETLKEAFELGVDKWGNAVAIEDTTGSLTYKELDEAADNCARELTALVKFPAVVAVLGDSSRNWILSALSVIKAGGTYLPLDIKLPAQRMAAMMETSGANLCIYPNAECAQAFSSLPGPKILLKDLLLSRKTSPVPARIPTIVTSDNYAYIIFTSGSTGTPKGIKVTHKATLSHLLFEPATMHARPGRRHAQIFSPGFDVNIAELFGTLCRGATLVLKNPADPFAHLKHVHAAMITPSFLSVLSPAEYPDLDTIYLIGEAVPQAVSDRWSVGRTLYNFYGPCECTIAATYTQLEPGRPVTVGKPIPRVGIYVLDPNNRPTPVGVIGEICISGVQVMEGYIGKDAEAMTQKAFFQDPFLPGQRMYRTGDLGVWTESMALEFLGRVDQQVKVRGYRVELGEIEQVIQQCTETVSQAAAVVAHDAIFAFVTPEAVNTVDVEIALRRKLPSYAVPQRIFTLVELPTTPNQKLDRKKLVQLAIGEGSAVSVSATDAQVSPHNTTEFLLAQAWREAIGLNEDVPIALDDDFMLIGGHSLRQITVARSVCSALGRSIPLGIFIVNTRFSTLAQAIDQFCKEESESQGPSFLEYWNTSGHDKLESNDISSDLSHLELELFHMQAQWPKSSSLNVAHIITMNGAVNVDALRKAILIVMSDNDILKSCFVIDEQGVPRRRPYAKELFVDILQGPIEPIVNAKVNLPFDLAEDQLTRIALVQDGSDIKIIFVQHHIITDQASSQLFFACVGQVYTTLLRGISPPKQAKPAYSTWATWKAAQNKKGPIQRDVDFWRAQFDGMTKSSHIWDSSKVSLTTAAHSAPFITKKPAWANSIEVYMSLIYMAWGLVTGREELLIGVPFIDRSEPGTSDMLGVFLDTLPVRLRVDRGHGGLMKWERIVKEAQKLVQGALGHAIPHCQIRECVGRQSLFDIMLVYNRAEEQVTRDMVIPGVSLSVEPRRAKGAKFPVLVEFSERRDEIVLEFEYFEEVINPATVAKVIRELGRMLDAASIESIGESEMEENKTL